MKLYVIGNGFDLHFKLHTDPGAFIQLLRAKKTYDGWSALDVFGSYGVDWSKYEGSLSYLDIDEIAEEHITSPDYLSDHEYDRDGTITNMAYYLNYLKKAVQESLNEMVCEANKAIGSVQFTEYDASLIDDVSPILNFNYTSTIEKLYHRQCFHIHGCYENGDQLIFGYLEQLKTKIETDLKSEWEEDHDYYIDTQKQLIVDFYHFWKKQLQIEQLTLFLSDLKSIDEVVVIGHAMGMVDSAYFELIEQLLKPEKWTVYCHEEMPQYRRYAFANKVTLINW